MGALVQWLRPMAPGAKVRRWQGEFAFGRIEVEEGDPAVLVRDVVRILAESGEGELMVSATMREGEAGLQVRLRALAGLVCA